MKYRFIAEHQQEYPITTMCQVLEVSVSGFYAWKQRPPSARQIADEALSARIRQVHQASHQIYGSRRIRAELAEEGHSCGRKRVVGVDGIEQSPPIANIATPSRPIS